MSTHDPIPSDNTNLESVNSGNDSNTATAFDAVASQTPWWAVSTLFHVLLIALIGLATITIELPETELVMVTQPMRPVDKSKAEPEPTDTSKDKGAILAPKDNSKDFNNVYTMPDFKGIESDVFETANDFVREHVGANGTPEALAMFSVKDPSEKPGSKGELYQTGAFVEDAIGMAGNTPVFSGQGKNGRGLTVGEGNNPFGRPNAAGQKNKFKKYLPNEVGRTQEWADAVKQALQWLAYHQEADGHWDVKKYGASNRNDVAVTSLSMLAFLGYGHSEKVGEYKSNLQSGVKWLIAHQEANGLIRSSDDDSAAHRSGGYPMAMATLALCEAAAMANVPETRAAAQKAVDYCVDIHQAGEGSERRGWRYAKKSEGDTSVTGWFIMALKTAKVAGLKVPHEAFDGAIRFIDSVEVKEKEGGNDYAPASHFKYMPNSDHAGSAHRLSAIAILARQFMGWKKEDLQSSVEWFINKGGVPAYGGNGEKVDLYYWYYGSMAAFQQDPAIFKTWGHGLLDALLPNQRKNGDEVGSWDATGDYSQEWGRVGQTALSALCLEVVFRQMRVYGK